MSLLGKRQTREHAADSEHSPESSAGVKKVKLAQDDAGPQTGQAVELNKLPRDKSQLPAEVWHHIFSPGLDGVAVIWPFASRLCGRCLVTISMKGIPFAYVTPDLRVQPSNTPDTDKLKLFSPTDVDEVTKEFHDVQALGPGAMDEWMKGLNNRGKNLQNQASRWEKWYMSGGVTRMRTELYPGHVNSKVSSVLTSNSATPAASPTSYPTAPPATRAQVPSSQASSQARQERTPEEVAELKAIRKAEIERRALLLDPPLTPNVLRHLPAFEAAMQIVLPFQDKDWDFLKPRLLTQRGEAEQRHPGLVVVKEEAQQDRTERHQLEATLATTKEARELIDKQWEETQAPLRARIAGLADEAIRETWGKGKKVTRGNCAKFAVDVLCYIRKRFYAEIAEKAAAARSAGREVPVDPPEGPFTQKLTLENMKWIFDTKIKPHTESYRKELFYCNGCDTNSKTFGFEGVIQHYAAKHTTALSLGTIVVHWRAEWPQYPPFRYNPSKQPPQSHGFRPSFHLDIILRHIQNSIRQSLRQSTPKAPMLPLHHSPFMDSRRPHHRSSSSPM
ncbi:hypothetical protein N0V85_001840 [Neurospora sp. IMI 360204]|nr:hypothetical protein N0V85_001840 [Neurospora sp. IMI 360204]